MARDYGKFFGLIFFSILLLVIMYLTLVLYNKKGKEKYNMITLHGNHLLNKESYLSFSGLDESDIFSDLTLNSIKTKIEKHPYVRKAEVKSDGRGNVDINIREKEIYAVIVPNGESYFITNDYEFIKIFNYTSYNDIPLVSNVRLGEKINSGKSLKNEDIVEAFKIIDAARITDLDISKRLMEINLKKGGDVILTFNGLKYPVIFGRGNEAKKMIYLSIMWDKIKSRDELFMNTEYIDLRFSNEAFISKKTGSV